MLLCLTAGAWVQSAIGFGYAIVALPAMLWTGVSLPAAVAATLASVVVQCGTGAYRFRAEVWWGDVLPMAVFRIAAMPVGVALLAMLDENDPAWARGAVGAVVLLAVALNAGFRPKPRAALPRVWTPVTGVSSGLLAGSLGIGGPPVVIWASAHDWPTRRTRAFLWLTFLLLTPPQLAWMLLRFGHSLLIPIAVGLATTPLVIFAGRLGSNAGDRLSRQQLRRVGYAGLTVIGLISLASPLLAR
ncbi:MAG: sulfite exporter TauE/SafE family protein [Planctomycetota bacterium]